MRPASAASVRPEQWQFHDSHVPASLLDMMRAGQLTMKEFLLLTVIGTLVQHSDDGNATGAWASNSYLATAIDAHPLHVSQSIQRLKGKGLLLAVTVNGQRYLELEWSRTAVEREQLAGRYGRSLRRAYHGLLKRVASQAGGIEKSIPYPKEKSIAPPIEISLPIATDKIDRLQKEGDAAATPHPLPPANKQLGGKSPRLNVLYNPSANRVTTPLKNPPDQRHVEAARKLHKALRDNCRRIKAFTGDWAEQARLLADRDGQDYAADLNWFCEHCSVEDQEKLRLPNVRNFKDFRNCYDWIGDRRIAAEKARSRKVQEAAIDDVW